MPIQTQENFSLVRIGIVYIPVPTVISKVFLSFRFPERSDTITNDQIVFSFNYWQPENHCVFPSVLLHRLRQQRQQRHHLRIRQHLRQQLRVYPIRHAEHFPILYIMQLRVQILLSVKCLLEQLRIFLPVLIQDM